MRTTLASVISLSLSWSAFAAQPQESAPSPNGVPAQELTPQVLGKMLRTATTFHELVTKMNLNKSLGPDQHVLGPDDQYHNARRPLLEPAQAQEQRLVA